MFKDKKVSCTTIKMLWATYKQPMPINPARRAREGVAACLLRPWYNFSDTHTKAIPENIIASSMCQSSRWPSPAHSLARGDRGGTTCQSGSGGKAAQPGFGFATWFDPANAAWAWAVEPGVVMLMTWIVS
jgi:hypothetical protein